MIESMYGTFLTRLRGLIVKEIRKDFNHNSQFSILYSQFKR